MAYVKASNRRIVPILLRSSVCCPHTSSSSRTATRSPLSCTDRRNNGLSTVTARAVETTALHSQQSQVSEQHLLQCPSRRNNAWATSPLTGRRNNGQLAHRSSPVETTGSRDVGARCRNNTCPLFRPGCRNNTQPCRAAVHRSYRAARRPITARTATLNRVAIQPRGARIRCPDAYGSTGQDAILTLTVALVAQPVHWLSLVGLECAEVQHCTSASRVRISPGYASEGADRTDPLHLDRREAPPCSGGHPPCAARAGLRGVGTCRPSFMLAVRGTAALPQSRVKRALLRRFMLGRAALRSRSRG